MSEFVLIRNLPTDIGEFCSIKVSSEAIYGKAYALYTDKGENWFGGLTKLGSALRYGHLSTFDRDNLFAEDGMFIWNTDTLQIEYYALGSWKSLDGGQIYLQNGDNVTITGSGGPLDPYIISAANSGNFANTNLTADANRVHDWAGFDFTLNNSKTHTIKSTEGQDFFTHWIAGDARVENHIRIKTWADIGTLTSASDTYEWSEPHIEIAAELFTDRLDYAPGTFKRRSEISLWSTQVAMRQDVSAYGQQYVYEVTLGGDNGIVIGGGRQATGDMTVVQLTTGQVNIQAIFEDYTKGGMINISPYDLSFAHSAGEYIFQNMPTAEGTEDVLLINANGALRKIEASALNTITILNNGTNVGVTNDLNFIAGSGTTIEATNDATNNKIDVTITSKEYTHIQAVTTNTWTVIHNLGKKCLVQVFVEDQEVFADIQHIDNNTLTINFSNNQSGYAICKI